MSVIVLDCRENRMYGDTYVTLGHQPAFKRSKVTKTQYGRFNILFGSTGIVEVADLMLTSVLGYLEKLETKGLRVGEVPASSLYTMEQLSSLAQLMSTFGENNYTDALVVIEDTQYNTIHYGVMNNNPLLVLGLRPIKNCLVIGSQETVAAFLAAEAIGGSVADMLNRVKQRIHYLRGECNEIESITLG